MPEDNEPTPSSSDLSPSSTAEQASSGTDATEAAGATPVRERTGSDSHGRPKTEFERKLGGEMVGHDHKTERTRDPTGIDCMVFLRMNRPDNMRASPANHGSYLGLSSRYFALAASKALRSKSSLLSGASAVCAGTFTTRTDIVSPTAI